MQFQKHTKNNTEATMASEMTKLQANQSTEALPVVSQCTKYSMLIVNML